MTTVPRTRLHDVAAINPPLGASLPDNEVVSFLPMSAVDAGAIDAIDTETRHLAEVREGYTPFAANDVLVAKITPCFENGKIAQAKLTHRIGFGSTEFHVVRADPHELDARYLVHFLRQPRIRREGERKMTGSAGQRRVPEYFIANLEIALPPLPEQRRIADILDKADALRAKRRVALKKLDELTQSIFLDMFGDPATNPNGLPKVPLHAVTTISTGGTPDRAVASFFDGHVPWVKTTEIGMNVIRDTEEKLTASGLQAIRNKLHPAGSIVIAMYGQGKTRGKSALLGIDAAVNQACAVLHPSGRFEPLFMLTQLQLEYERIRALGRGGNQENLNLARVGSFEVLLPAKDQQLAFTARVAAVRAVKALMDRSLAIHQAAFDALQHRAFCGEL